ncbi:MAG: malto-oligosyltrehalose synthase [Acidimicrobiia bacterium]
MPAARRAPRATYRVQLQPAFTFDDAAAIVDYLAELGISHLYCSPYLQAAPGSTHGYDVVDHRSLNAELGGEEAHARLSEALEAHGMGQVLDIVPNHMALSGPRNAWWWDVLENGPSSQYASYFDINWRPTEEKLANKVLVPILGDHYGRVLEKGELRLERRGGEFVIRYYDEAVPVSPRTIDDLLAAAAATYDNDDLLFLSGGFGRLPHAAATDRASVTRRHRDKEVLKRQLAQLCESDEAARAAVDDAVARTNEQPDLLDALIERQNYRLALWRVAGQELDYRRFFDITSLVGLRMEDPQVFNDTHALVLRLVQEGKVHGLRIDHPDGMRDPAGYLERLAAATNGTYTVVEKILEVDEQLRESWPVAGTTGYDFLNVAGGLLVDEAAEAQMTDVWVRFAGGEFADYEELTRDCKWLAMRTTLAADIERLVALFVDVCEANRRYRDYTRNELREALRETIAAFDVYRTYVRPHAVIEAEDIERVESATRQAAERRDDLDPMVFELLADVLLLRVEGSAAEELSARFQQTSAAVMAKGVEDTAFYRYNRLVSLNEVGGDPYRFGVSPDAFHERISERVERWPHAMLSSSTHDTKRSEDVRARLALLSEIPEEWESAVYRWAHLNDAHRTEGLPDRNAEYLLYQVLVGAWPLDVDRATAYMEKASKEAKVHTSWVSSNAAYDDALRRFVEQALGDPDFVRDVDGFVAPLVDHGRTNSLAQTLVKLTAPGVPDIYQGSEVWDLSLVDPDNRRPVDYELRRSLLGEVSSGGAAAALARSEDGGPKMLVVERTLGLRRESAALNGDASYEPLTFGGAAAGNAVGYLRGGEIAVVVPRLPVTLERNGGWGDTRVSLPAGTWRNVFTGSALAGGDLGVAEVLAGFPVALLRKD